MVALISESESMRKGQGGYLQYDPFCLEIDPATLGAAAGEGDGVKILSVNGKPFDANKQYTVILVVKMMMGMDDWKLLTEYGEKIPTLQALLDSGPGMATLVINQLLKSKWLQL